MVAVGLWYGQAYVKVNESSNIAQPGSGGGGIIPNTVKLYILEWPFIVASLRHTCAIIMLSNQHLDMPHITCEVDGLSRQRRSAH